MNYEWKYGPSALALYAALAEDAFYIAMQASVEGLADEGREAMLRYYDYSMQEAYTYGVLQLTDDSASGAALWTMPIDDVRSVERDDAKKRFLASWMGASSLDTYLRITSSMENLTAPAVPPGCWYLSILGVDPALQGRGVGAQLLRPMLERADGAGRASYLETFTPRNIAFYERLGFDVKRAVDEPVTGSRYWVLVRDPR